MKLKIEFNLDNAAFNPYPSEEIARILKELAGDIEGCRKAYPITIMDWNGNAIGTARLIKERNR